MALKAEMRVYDFDGTHLEGPRDNGSSLVYEFTNNMYLPTDVENRFHQSRIRDFMIVKEIDQLTPQLYQALAQNAQWEKVVITLFRINPTAGDEEPYFEFTLEDVRITSVQTYMKATNIREFEDLGHLEKVVFHSRTITWTHLPGNIEFTDEAF